jgi:hypothetical protein
MFPYVTAYGQANYIRPTYKDPIMSLPDDIITHILEKRDVYVVNYHEPNFDLSRWKCLGVYNTKDAAKRAAARIALESIDSFSSYDPAKRYYQRQDSETKDKVWKDRWPGTLGVCIYTVETRRLDSDEIPSETLYFNFDAFFKRMLEDNGTSSIQARNMLTLWKLEPPYPLLIELFGPEEDHYKPLKQDREAWLEKHGCVSHYPYGEYDPI